MKPKQLVDMTFSELVQGYEQRYIIPADERIRILGRNPRADNEIKIEIPKIKDTELQKRLEDIYMRISRVHALILNQRNGVVYIIPQKTKNPTLIDGVLLKQKEQLFDNQIITLGEYNLQLKSMDLVAEKKAEEKLEKRLYLSETDQEDLSAEIMKGYNKSMTHLE